MQYNTAKPQEVLDEDKIVERWPLHLSKDNVRVVPVETVFEN
jgi:zinc protease